MCGLAGRFNHLSGAPVDASVVAAMCELLAHRGPDGQGVWCRAAIGLGHRRLAIIDLSPLGRQPMTTEDGAIVVTYNGEIYNYRELREELLGKGHRFRSQSDTEVVLAAYREWGPACVERLAGMFALALWDEPRRRLLLARDRFGKKPLFYRLDPDGLAFASEPKAFLAEPGFEPRPDLQAVSQYLSYQYVPAPRSGFAGVAKLLPGHTLVLDQGGQPVVERYWRLSYARKVAMEEEEALAAVDASLRQAVRRRLVSDVPLGAFLSGGIDSGLVVSYMAEALDEPVRTFSIGFVESGFDELPAARLVARRYATEHREFVVRPSAAELLDTLVWHFGEPYADSSALPTYVLAQLTRQHVTVALNGDAGDEAFAGYDRYLASELAMRGELLPASLRRLVARGGSGIARHLPGLHARRAARFLQRTADRPAARYAGWTMHFDPATKAELCTPAFQAATAEDSVALLEHAFAGSDAGNSLERTLDVDTRTYLPDDLLVKVDIACMAHGLEARSPFLDHELMQLAASLPPGLKLHGRRKKYLLRRLAERRLPMALAKLPKKGFGVPIERWFRDELRGLAHDVLLDSRTRGRGWFRPEFVSRMLAEHVAGRRSWHYQLWNLMMLELWLRMYVDERPSAAPPRPVVLEERALRAASEAQAMPRTA